MNLEAFILPLPGRSVGVVFWDRARRTGGESGLAVYAPTELSPGELSEVAGSLAASLGAATAEPARRGPAPALLIAWWLLGVLAMLAAALHALSAGPALVWLACIAVGATLPWGMTAGAAGAARRAAAARRVVRHLGELDPVAGADPRARERLASVWQFARTQRGSEPEQALALERFCEEQAWPAAAAVYRARVAAPVEERRWLPSRSADRRARLFSQCEMRAWPST